MRLRDDYCLNAVTRSDVDLVFALFLPLFDFEREAIPFHLLALHQDSAQAALLPPVISCTLAASFFWFSRVMLCMPSVGRPNMYAQVEGDLMSVCACIFRSVKGRTHVLAQWVEGGKKESERKRDDQLDPVRCDGATVDEEDELSDSVM